MVISRAITPINGLGGGFNHFLCSPLFGEDFQLGLRIFFQMGGEKATK